MGEKSKLSNNNHRCGYFLQKILKKPQKSNSVKSVVQHGQSIYAQELLKQLLYFYILAAKNKI